MSGAENTPSTFSTLRKDGSIAFIIYVVAWLLASYMLPDALIKLMEPYTNFVMTIIPSIAAYADNSPDANRVAAFYSIQWSLCPFYMLLAFRKYRHLRAAHTMSLMQGVRWMLVALTFCGAAVFFPNHIDINPEFFNRAHRWDALMHESYWPNSLMAICIPFFFSVFLFFIYLLAKATRPISSLFNKE